MNTVLHCGIIHSVLHVVPVDTVYLRQIVIDSQPSQNRKSCVISTVDFLIQKKKT